MSAITMQGVSDLLVAAGIIVDPSVTTRVVLNFGPHEVVTAEVTMIVDRDQVETIVQRLRVVEGDLA